MRKKLYSVLLVTLNLLNSCSCYDEMWFNKEFPPQINKIWYSQNGEDKPNFDFVLPSQSEEDYKKSFCYLIFKGEKKKLDFTMGYGTFFSFYPYGETSLSGKDGNTSTIRFLYNTKKTKDIIHLKNDGSNLDKFGVNLADYLPFDLYIKEYDEEEWYSKYPEDRKE